MKEQCAKREVTTEYAVQPIVVGGDSGSRLGTGVRLCSLCSAFSRGGQIPFRFGVIENLLIRPRDFAYRFPW